MIKDKQQEPEVAYCEICDSELYNGEEVLLYDGCLFCDWDCVINHLTPVVKTVEIKKK